jgi:hypothetical protein
MATQKNIIKQLKFTIWLYLDTEPDAPARAWETSWPLTVLRRFVPEPVRLKSKASFGPSAGTGVLKNMFSATELSEGQEIFIIPISIQQKENRITNSKAHITG